MTRNRRVVACFYAELRRGAHPPLNGGSRTVFLRNGDLAKPRARNLTKLLCLTKQLPTQSVRGLGLP